jgi:thioredoxin-related protein
MEKIIFAKRALERQRPLCPVGACAGIRTAWSARSPILHTTCLLLAIILLPACRTVPHADLDGEWLEDFGPAKAIAREKRLPILLNFTGSDWCPPCQMMEKEVFSKPAWKAYAKKQLVPVAVEISIEEMKDMRTADPRNDALRIAYDITGYPTYVLLDHDGETELGRLRGRQLACLIDPSPNIFPELLRPFFHYGRVEIERAAKAMPPNDRKVYLDLAAQRKKLIHSYQDALAETAKVRRQSWHLKAEAREKMSPSPKEVEEVNKKLGKLHPVFNNAERTAYTFWSEAEEIEEKMRNLRVAQLSEGEQMEYKELVPRVAEARHFQGSWEDKVKYYRLLHQQLLY